jgi:thiol:disulfide interchange protein
MSEMIEKRRDGAMWLGFLLALAAVLCNVVLLLFANLPGNRAVPWLSVLLAVLGLIFLAVGLWRTFAQPRVYRAKILGSIVSLVSLLFACMAIFVSLRARALPPSTGAPQVGQKAPDFTLADTAGQLVSLDRLFAAAPGDPQGVAPRAVLLIFYRGYW